MKKIFLIATLSFTVLLVKAQDYDKITQDLIIKQPEAAKTELDKVMADQKAASKPTTWFYKGAVYAAIYAQPDAAAKYTNPEMTADSAFRKYVQADTSFAALKDYQLGAQPFFDMYSTSFNHGIRTFNAKKWDSSCHYFSISEYYSEILFKRKLTRSTASFDTLSTEYAGFAFQNNGQMDAAIKYYKILADNKVSGPDFKEMYQNMLNYYSKNKDNTDFEPLLAEVKKLYPADIDTWNEFEIENMDNSMNVTDIAAKYKQDDAAGKITTSGQYIGYAEAFVSIPKEQLNNIDSAKQVDFKYLAADAYKKAFNFSNNGLFAFNAGVMYYNIYTTLDDRYYNLRGEAAGLKAQRTEVEKQEFILGDSAANWLTKAYNILKAKTDRTKAESNSLNHAVDFLANIYAWERDKNKGVNPANVDKYDALFKQFDAEHDKYKE